MSSIDIVHSVSPNAPDFSQKRDQSPHVSSQLWYAMRKSYGMAPNKWNDLENCPNPSAIFRFDLEESLFPLFVLLYVIFYCVIEALEREERRAHEEEIASLQQKQVEKERIERIRRDFRKHIQRREAVCTSTKLVYNV